MQLKYHMVTIEDLVPENHFLRKLEAVLDLTFVYEETAQLYSRKYGRPPIDPVIIVKYLLVGFLYGIPSERQRTAAHFAGILVSTWMNGCRITARSASCGGGSLRFGRCSGDCLRKWWGSA